MKTDSRLLMILARTIDYRIGRTDLDKPDLPILNTEEALIAFFIKFIIVMVNFVTCGFVIASIIRHW